MDRPDFDFDKVHIARRVQHAVTGIVLLAISHIIQPYPAGCLLLLLATVAFYIIHMKRIHDRNWDEWYIDNFGSLLRNHERGEWDTLFKERRKTVPSVPGAFYFLLGAFLTTLLFPATVARTSVLVLSISDPIAGLVGSSFTNKKYNIPWKQLFARSNAVPTRGPTLAGSLGFLLSAILCTYVYIPSNISIEGISLSFQSRLIIGVFASIVEAVGVVDDNLLIPLVVGFFICIFNL